MKQFIVELDPYAMVTFALNARYVGHFAENANIKWLRKEVGRFALRLDEAYHETNYVTERVPREERFEAICFPEKLLGHPHAHCLFVPMKKNCSPAEIQQRADFLLQAAHTPSNERGIREAVRLAEIQSSKARRTACLLKRRFGTWKGDVRLIWDAAGIASYVLKEYNNTRSENMTSFFFLSDFHSDRYKKAS